MKNAYIIHGWDGSPKEVPLQWLRTQLEQIGYEVEVPAMPNPEEPTIESWVGKLNEIVNATSETILVGHSIGCQAVLRYLAQTSPETRVAGIVLVAPWMELDAQTIKEEGPEVEAMAAPWMQTPIDFATIKERTSCITAIFSDDDPFVSLTQEELFKKELGAKTIVEHAKGHFLKSDGVTTLPSALEAIKRCLTQ